MRPTESSDDFEQRLERDLRLHVARAQRAYPAAMEPAYRSALRRGGASFRTSGILGKGAALLVAAVLTIGGGSVVAMATTGSNDPIELAHSVAQIVAACKDQIRGDDTAARNSRGIGQCVSAQVSHNRNGKAHQQANGATGAGSQSSPNPSSSPSTHHAQGQGNSNGSVGAPGQSGIGRGNGNGQGDHGSSGSRGHHPTPTPNG